MQDGQSATQGQGEQEAAVDQVFQKCRPATVDGVIGGFLVGTQCDALGKLCRDLLAVLGDVADVTEFQPLPGSQTEQETTEEKLGEIAGGQL